MSLAPTSIKDGHSQVGLYTYRYHRLFAVFDALYQSAFFGGAFTFVVLKTLDVPSADAALYSVLLSFFPTIFSMSAPLWGTSGGKSGKYWLTAGVFARILPATLIAFVHEPWQAVVLITLMSFFGSGVPPMQNTLFGRNYLPSERDKFHGRSKIYFIPILISANLLMMWQMDRDPSFFRVAYPIAGVFGLLSCLVMYRARVRWVPPAVKYSGKFSSKDGIFGRFAQTSALFKRDMNFAIYELSFMLYGCGFMILGVTIPVFYLQRFDVKYGEFSVYTMLLFQGTILLSHLWLRGRTSRWSATKIAGSSFTFLIFVPLVLLLASAFDVQEVSIAAFIVQGVGMALLGYAWNYGPIRFARGGDPKPYVSAHMSLVGVRGLIAYPLAYWLLTFAKGGDYLWVLCVPALLFLLASLTNWRLSRRLREAGISA